jgi:hypothetical protein
MVQMYDEMLNIWFTISFSLDYPFDSYQIHLLFVDHNAIFYQRLIGNEHKFVMLKILHTLLLFCNLLRQKTIYN